MRKIKTLIPLFIFISIAIVFFYPFLFKGLIPFPGDIILGSYHPFKDVIWEGRKAGFPVKNFIINDVVKQLYPWRFLAISLLKKRQLPLWNPYQFTGTPLLAQIFTGVFYPLNIFFFIFDFNLTWGLLIFFQPILVSIFTYLFLRNLKISSLGSFVGGIIFAYSSFLMMRLEWSIVGHTAAWLPLVLLSIDKIFEKNKFRWFLLLTISLTLSILAGYLQVIIYIYVLSFFYFIFRFWQKRKLNWLQHRVFFVFLGFFLSLFLAGVQIIPLAEFLSLSARIGNVKAVMNFFLPWRHLIMFIAPDFFGNPATGNYWGNFNYTEFCGYVGIFSLFLVILTIFGWKNKEVKFWQGVILVSFIFVLPTPISKLFYESKIPLFSNLTPSRLIFLIDFSLAVLAAFGFDRLYKETDRKKLEILVSHTIYFLIKCYIIVILLFLAGFLFWFDWQKNVLVSVRNLILPSLLLGTNLFLVSFYLSFRQKRIRKIFLFILVAILVFDLFRHGRKYNSFIKSELIFPTTKTIEFLQSQREKEPFRFQNVDVELFPANLGVIYGIEAIDGYDPFFSRRFAQLAWVGNTLEVKNLETEFSRVIFLGNYTSPIFDALNTKYILSLRDLSSEKHLRLIMEEGKTRLYQNLQAGPRAFLADKIIVGKDEKNILELMLKRNLKKEVILEREIFLSSEEINEKIEKEEVQLRYPSVNKATINVSSNRKKLLVLMDSFYPGWKVFVDGNPQEILRVNYNFRGVIVPSGNHLVEFIYDPLSFRIGLYLSLGTFLMLLGGTIVILVFRKEWW